MIAQSATAVPKGKAAGSASPEPGMSPGAGALALLSRAARSGKAKGQNGLAAALEPGAHKGAGSFANLLIAKAAGKDAAQDAAASLKLPALKTPGAKNLLLDGSAQPSAGPAAGLVKDEKMPAKKKPAQMPAVTNVSLAVQAAAPSERLKIPAAGGIAADGSSTDVKGGTVAAQTAGPRREPVIKVVDLRTKAKQGEAEGSVPAKFASQPLTADKDASALPSSKPVLTRDAAVSSGPAPAAPSVPQAPLDRLRDMAGSELIKATNLVLRDGGGEIRLVLKPESLGSVRIRMNVVDNAIEGRIIVDSSSVKQVFDANLDALRRALTAEGFQAGSLQVSVGGESTDADARREQQPSETVRRTTAQGFERNVPGLENVSLGDLLVNLFA